MSKHPQWAPSTQIAYLAMQLQRNETRPLKIYSYDLSFVNMNFEWYDWFYAIDVLIKLINFCFPNLHP